MKKIAILGLGVLLVAVVAFAQDAAVTEAPAAAVTEAPAAAVTEAPTATPVVETAAPVVMSLKGIIIDNLCAEANKADLATFITTHPKECALKPECVASGYSIYSDNTLMKFDAASNAKVEEFLKKEDSKLQVVVEANKTGEELSLVSIKNQE
jgi:hypothetical protein